MGIYKENRIPRWVGILVLAAAFLVLYEPWFLGLRELFRLEGFYAVQSAEFSIDSAMVTAHGVAIRNAYPLYPALAALLNRGLGLEMELSLRLLSVIMVAAATVVVYVAAASERSSRAGLAASAMFLGTNLMLDKAVDGDPAMLNVFLLLSAQLMFFQFGVRRANWSMGWICSLWLLSLGFLSGGFWVVLLFVFPMFFFRRPLSVKSKFRKIGFPIGVAILVGTILLWGIPYWILSHSIPLESFWFDGISLWEYLLKLVTFPFEFAMRLLPWTLIAWIPFCVALQALDETPILSRYLRTLAISTLFLLWFLPDNESRDLIYMLGPLSILVGINYDLAMRRYGIKLRKALILCEYFLVGAAIGIGVVCFVPEHLLDNFVSLSNSTDFSGSFHYRLFAMLSAGLLLALAFYLHYGKKSRALWLMLLCTSMGMGIFFWSVIQPYRVQDHQKRKFGMAIAQILSDEPVKILYKSNILDLYGELYYAGVEVRKLQEPIQIPAQAEVVYLLGTEFPQQPDRVWTNLLPADYTYRRHRLGLWRGVLRSSEEK
ncbi:MAG: hypothetical protein LBM70_07475 [Victivallales bacterium]|nr:hypothetical protein [Victivallales bacterium]